MENIELLLESFFAGNESAIAKDLKLNLKKYFGQSVLNLTESALLAYSLSFVLNIPQIQKLSFEILSLDGMIQDQIVESQEIGSIMGMLNTYYKFKHFLGHNQNYGPAGLRMNALGKHSLSKSQFEMLAFAHSLINGCEFCVKAHEKELLKLEVGEDKIHDVARLSSVLKGISNL